MRLSLTKLSGALIAGAAALALAGAASAGTAKPGPQARAKLQTKTDCPSGPSAMQDTEKHVGGMFAGKKPERPDKMTGLNPQPEPPSAGMQDTEKHVGGMFAARKQAPRGGGKKPADPLAAKGFNSQPEPPGKRGVPPNPC